MQPQLLLVDTSHIAREKEGEGLMSSELDEAKQANTRNDKQSNKMTFYIHYNLVVKPYHNGC